MNSLTKVAICSYPDALKSAIYGLEEMFHLCNVVCQQNALPKVFSVDILPNDKLEDGSNYSVVILPPSQQSEFYLAPNNELISWLQAQHLAGAVVTSACAGAFILCRTNIIKQRNITTHWGLAEQLEAQFPEVNLASTELIIAW